MRPVVTALLCAALFPPLAASGATQGATFNSLPELDTAMAAVAAGELSADTFWARVRSYPAQPLVFGPTAVFFWRGDAKRVEWRGDLVGWEAREETRGHRVGASDIWTWRHDLLPASRADYKLVVDDSWLLDPLNPNQQMGGYGPNSELRMPGWQPPADAARRLGVARGALTDLPFASQVLGYQVTVRVYTPAGFVAPAPGATPAVRYPTLYVTDGSDYWRDEMGSLPITLDNLIAERRLAPVVVVFIDPWDAKHAVNRRREELVPAADGSCKFCDFIVQELVPTVGRRYPTLADAAHRGILGTSLGGLNATFMVTAHRDVFGLAGIQSPALRWGPDVPGLIRRTSTAPLRAVVDTGLYEGDMLDEARLLVASLGAKGTQVKTIEVPDGHSWGHWRATLADLLVFLYGGGA
jgi:enterochelin esterase family protein